MPKKHFPLLEALEITSMSSEGKAIGRHDNKVVFVPFAVPGDIVDVQIIKKKKNFEEGVIVQYRKYSDQRVEAPCEHFGICGGCKWQNILYEEQVRFKQQQVEDSFKRIGHLEIPSIMPIITAGKIFYYRNKLEYSFNNRRWLLDTESHEKEAINANGLGFHLPGLWDRILDIHHCYLQEDPSNTIRNSLKSYALQHKLSFYDQRRKEGFLRNVLIRNTTTSQWMIMIIFGYEDMPKREALLDFVLEQFPFITSLVYAINEKTNDTYSDLLFHPYKSQEFIVDEMENLKFRVSPTSFYQTNSEQVLKLYRTVLDFAALTGIELVYDLYTGTGTIANFIALKAKKVIGVEYIEDAVKDAEINSNLNHIDNVTFFAGDMAKTLNEAFFLKNGKPDVVITDPPRAGMSEKVIYHLLQARPKRIVYVSCNPATQARDLALMKDFYAIVKIQPIDMFPHTHHVENIALLEIKS